MANIHIQRIYKEILIYLYILCICILAINIIDIDN